MDGKNQIGDQEKDALLAPDDHQDYGEKRFISYGQLSTPWFTPAAAGESD